MTKGECICTLYIDSSMGLCVSYVLIILYIPCFSTSIYLELCIKTVLNLYKNQLNPPTSVSIVAHSMVCSTETVFIKMKAKVNAMAAAFL